MHVAQREREGKFKTCKICATWKKEKNIYERKTAVDVCLLDRSTERERERERVKKEKPLIGSYT